MTLEQQRAAMAYGHVQQVEPAHRDLYGGMAQKLPALIRNAGLCQAIYFVKSRKEPALNRLLEHLGVQLKRIDPGIENVDDLCRSVREADLSGYIWLTREALASVTWYGRLARSEWGILLGEEKKG